MLVIFEQKQRITLEEQAVGIPRLELQGFISLGEGVRVVGKRDELLGQAQGGVGVARGQPLGPRKLAGRLPRPPYLSEELPQPVTGVRLIYWAVDRSEEHTSELQSLRHL